jgi:hypothetical protein
MECQLEVAKCHEMQLEFEPKHPKTGSHYHCLRGMIVDPEAETSREHNIKNMDSSVLVKLVVLS